MILSKDYSDINSVYDFLDGIITEIKWDVSCADLLVTVNYYFDEPQGCKDQDLTICFKKCSYAKFDMQDSITAMKADSIGSVWHNVESIGVKKTTDCIYVVIASNFSEKMLELSCQEIWIEKGIPNEMC